MNAHNPALPGKIYLLEAPVSGLAPLTPDALALLRRAEVVLHDHHVSGELLDLLPVSAQVRNVGPHDGRPALPVEQVHSLMANASREGHLVVRITSPASDSSTAAGPASLDALRRSGLPVESLSAPPSARRASITTH